MVVKLEVQSAQPAQMSLSSSVKLGAARSPCFVESYWWDVYDESSIIVYTRLTDTAQGE